MKAQVQTVPASSETKANLKDYSLIFSRLLLSGVFLKAGIDKVLAPAATQAFMSSVGMPFTSLFLIAAIAMEIGGGISLATGYKTRWGAATLSAFLVPATLIFHTNFSDQMQQLQFLKNSAILGGLVSLVVSGGGNLAITKEEDDKE